MTTDLAATSTETGADEISAPLLAFIAEHTKRAWSPTEDLFEAGAVSSLFALQLVVFLEKTFDIEIGGEDLRLDNFRTVEKMADLVTRLRDE